jgi:hypothetical protein
MRMKWENDCEGEWAWVGCHLIHVTPCDGEWRWQSIDSVGSCADPSSARAAAEQAAVAHVTEIAKALGLTVSEVP